MDLINDFDSAAFNLALSSLLYRGEFCPELEFYPDFQVKLTTSGKAYRGHYIKHYLPQISVSTLKSIFSNVCRGSQRAQAQASLLYRLGLGVPQDKILSALFTHMPYKGQVETPDGTLISFADIKAAFKHHLKTTFNHSGTRVYFSKYVNYYLEIHKYTQSESKRKPTDFIALLGSEADIYVTYAESKASMKLSGVVALLRGKMYDITYQSLKEQIVPASLPSKFPDKPGQRLLFVGKFANKSDVAIDLDAYVKTYIHDQSQREDQTTAEEHARNSVRALTSDKEIRALRNTHANLKSKGRLSTKQKLVLEDATKTLRKHASLVKAAKHQQAIVEESRSLLPENILEFIAYDVLMPSSSTNSYSTGLMYRTVRGTYESVVDNINSLGFKTMPIATRKPRNCKDFIGIKGRYTKGSTAWAKDLI